MAVRLNNKALKLTANLKPGTLSLSLFVKNKDLTPFLVPSAGLGPFSSSFRGSSRRYSIKRN